MPICGRIGTFTDRQATMSDSWGHSAGGPAKTDDAARRTSADERVKALPRAAEYGLVLVFVALATVLAFVAEHVVATPNLTLIFVLPVVAAAIAFGWGPAFAAAMAGVLSFDFFFTQPYHSFRISNPSDLWAAGLLLVIAAIVSSLAAESRRRAIAAEKAAEDAQALQRLARVIIEGRPECEILRAAADALHRAFGTPAVICVRSGDSLAQVASAGGARLTDADREAALAALGARLAMRGGTYPNDKSSFDFWPVATPAGPGWVLGVAFRPGERPKSPERFVDIVCGYIAAAVTPQLPA
jgi:K+-sensing histidine kinase KdpD